MHPTEEWFNRLREHWVNEVIPNGPGNKFEAAAIKQGWDIDTTVNEYLSSVIGSFKQKLNKFTHDRYEDLKLHIRVAAPYTLKYRGRRRKGIVPTRIAISGIAVGAFGRRKIVLKFVSHPFHQYARVRVKVPKPLKTPEELREIRCAAAKRAWDTRKNRSYAS